MSDLAFKSSLARLLVVLEETRGLLGQAARGSRSSGAVVHRGELSAAGKAGSAVASTEYMLGAASGTTGICRVRLLLHAFDASWIGWNACFSRRWSTPSGDLRQYLAGLDSLAPLLRRGAALGEHRRSFSTSLRSRCSKGARGRKVIALAHLLDASKGTGNGWRRKEAEARVQAAARARATNTDVLHALYDVRCARLHGNLWPWSFGRLGAMRDLALASTGLTLGLIRTYVRSSLP